MGGQRSPRLTGANHWERKESSPQDVPVKESRHIRVPLWWCHLSACDKDPMKEKIGSFWSFCTVPFCNVNWTRWRRRSLIRHVDDQTSCLLIFLVYLNIHSFDLWHTFLCVSAPDFVEESSKSEATVKSDTYVSYCFVCPHIFLNLFFFFLSFLACQASTCSKTLDRCSYCYRSPADKRSLLTRIINV